MISELPGIPEIAKELVLAPSTLQNWYSPAIRRNDRAGIHRDQDTPSPVGLECPMSSSSVIARMRTSTASRIILETG